MPVDPIWIPKGYEHTAQGFQKGPFNRADLDPDGSFNVDKFIARLRVKHAAWNAAHPIGPGPHPQPAIHPEPEELDLNAGDPCPTCGAPLFLIEDVPKPHHAKLECNLGHFAQWVQQDMTYDIAANFIMFLKPHKDLALKDVPRDFLHWCIYKLNPDKYKSLLRAVRCFLDGPEDAREELMDIEPPY